MSPHLDIALMLPKTLRLMAEPKTTELMEKIVSLCKRKGLIFQSSELYGGPLEVPDLVISDIRMPGYSGFEVLAGLRRADRRTPFILITALGEHETYAEARRLGATFIFHKPFEVDDLRTAVLNLVPPGHSDRPLRGRTVGVTAGPVAAASPEVSCVGSFASVIRSSPLAWVPGASGGSGSVQPS